MCAQTPIVRPVSDTSPRPFWSIMIPTYNSGDYLRATLASVLQQDAGSDHMHIEIVDGCSTTDDPERVVNDFGRGRVALHRLDTNRGPAHTLNACIERSRGRWVHILHGDDMVRPGFYAAYEAVIREHPEASTVVGQSVVIDEQDRWTKVVGPMPTQNGMLADFTEKLLWEQPVRAPAVVVARSAYERAGGFCPIFRHVLDWDLYFRLGLVGPVACVPQPYALYRTHSGSETSRLLTVSDSQIREPYVLFETNVARLGKEISAERRATRRAEMAAHADGLAYHLEQHPSGHYIYAQWAWMLEPTAKRGARLLKAWLRTRLGANTVSGLATNHQVSS